MKERKKVKTCTEVSTEIVCILDKSGSMNSIREDTIGSYNAFLKDQQKLPGKATLTLTIFDDEYEILHNNVDIQCAESLTTKTYVPNGTTALYDAIGVTINKIESRLECGEKRKVLIAIITDGQENASKEYDKCQIMKLIDKCKCSYGWEFIYLSASPSAFGDSASIGISSSRTFNFKPTRDGVGMSMARYGCCATSYRSSGSISDFTTPK